MIRALDHVVIAVRDLSAAVAAYERLLGRAPSWRAEAHGAGAEIAAFGLTNTPLELMVPSGDGPVAYRLRAALDAQGEGLASLAFAVDDIERAHFVLRLYLGGAPPASARWRFGFLAGAAYDDRPLTVSLVSPEPPSPTLGGHTDRTGLSRAGSSWGTRRSCNERSSPEERQRVSWN